MSIQPPAAASAADAAHIQVLLVGIGHYPHLDGKELPGTQGDLVIWHGLLNRMGIPSENMWLAASPVDVSTEGAQTEDAQIVAQLLSTLPAGQVCKDGTQAGIEALTKAFVARLGDAGSTINRALVFWAGHGFSASDGSLHLATADTALVGGGPLGGGGSFSGLMAWNDFADLLDQRPEAVKLTLVVDTCFAAAGPGHRTLTQTAPKARRAGLTTNRDADIVLSASLGGQLALEVAMHKRWVGAFSWAVTCILGRWGQSQQQAGMEISLNSLMARAGALLFAAEIQQTPAFDGPAEDGLRRFLEPPEDAQVGDSEPEGLPGSEIDPGSTGRVYELKSNGNSIGQLWSSASSVRLAQMAKYQIWWSALPQQDFTIEAATTPTSGVLTKSNGFQGLQTHGPWTQGAWEIRKSTTTDTSPPDGYMYATTTDVVLLRVSGTTEFGYGTKFKWVATGFPAGSYHKASCALVT
jgi:hypothetical protein